MKLTTHFYLTPSRDGAKPYCFNTVTDDFASVAEARAAAISVARTPGNGATLIMIENEQGENVAHLIKGTSGWSVPDS